MPTDLIHLMRDLLGNDIRETQHVTTKGELYVPNENLRLGPEFLIRIHNPLNHEEIDWDITTQYLHGGNIEVCHQFFQECNGFAFARRFSSPGIMTDNPYDGKGLSSLNVPYDLGTVAYGSYPQFGPDEGYFIAQIRIGPDNREICDVVRPDGRIVFGEFRKNAAILGEFVDLSHWLKTRVPQVLSDMETDGLIS